MAKLCLKKTSKRITCRQRYKIEKRVRDHNRKLKKELKKKGGKGKPKFVQIPNSCPFKADILKEVAQLKQKNEEEKELKRQQIREERQQLKNKETTFEGLVSNAQANQKEFEKINNTESINNTKFKDPSFKAFYKEFKKVIEEADVILEVLDSRDPLGTRCSELEQAVLDAGPNKRLVLVLNKADLVPRDNLDSWLKYLRQSFPVVPFKASTQKQSRNLGRKQLKPWTKQQVIQKSSTCIGAELLMSLLGNYCRNKEKDGEIKMAIKVGVVGLPNVGKSSIINSLKRSRACNVGAVPGVTKSKQVVQLDSKIQLLDCPGVIMSTSGSEDSIALKNVINLATLRDPITPANAILKRISRDQLRDIYQLTDFSTSQEFLTLLAKRMGRYKKGGVTDVNVSAKILIEDWNKGKIRYCTLPPEQRPDDEIHLHATIIKEFTKEFNIESDEAMETQTLALLDLENKLLETPVPLLEPANTEEESMNVDADEADGIIGENVIITENQKIKKKRFKKNKKNAEKIDTQMSLEGNLQLNKTVKIQQKKSKKNKIRFDRREKEFYGEEMDD